MHSLGSILIVLNSGRMAMNCWEHAAAKHMPVRAVAMCVHCGAGVCLEHATVCEEERTRRNGTGAPSRLMPNGREICCSTCHAAFSEAVPSHEAALLR
ncbi:DUF2180 family protein [Brevibacterium sandarakinum]|uniref:DUF2180 family protein n=1 Tax=Brevibacterium sandarakinum TaxID=629680 RepID=UPI000B8491E6